MDILPKFQPTDDLDDFTKALVEKLEEGWMLGEFRHMQIAWGDRDAILSGSPDTGYNLNFKDEILYGETPMCIAEKVVSKIQEWRDELTNECPSCGETVILYDYLCESCRFGKVIE